MQGARIAVGHERRALLVAREHEAHPGGCAQHVQDRQVHRAGNAEDMVDAFAPQAVDERLRASDHGSLLGC
jgi:hypothetical protein